MFWAINKIPILFQRVAMRHHPSDQSGPDRRAQDQINRLSREREDYAVALEEYSQYINSIMQKKSTETILSESSTQTGNYEETGVVFSFRPGRAQEGEQSMENGENEELPRRKKAEKVATRKQDLERESIVLIELIHKQRININEL